MVARTLILLLTLPLALAPGRAQAVTKTWIGTDGGSFSTPANWDQAGTPGTSDSILFANGTVASPYDINFDVNATVTQAVIATNPLSFAGGSHTLSLTSTSTTNASRALVIGRTGAAGTSNASLTSSLTQLTTTSAVLGLDTGTVGTLNLTAGTFSVTGLAGSTDLLIGYSGAGNINVSGGAHVTVTGETSMATFGESVGSISITGSGSTWNNTGSMTLLKGTATIIVADGGTLTFGARLDLGFGVLAGDGNVNGSVANGSGTVAPSSLTSSYGTLHITGAYNQFTGGKIQIEIGGTTLGTEYDRLAASNSIGLGGTLQVTLAPSFTPAQGNVFDILDFTSTNGTFSTLTLPALPGSLEWDTSKLYTEGKIAVVLPGDFNQNGIVDAADYTVWRKGLGTTYVAADYTTWRSHLSKTATGSAAGLSASLTGAVPEPTPLMLVLFGIVASTAMPRRRNLSPF
jgi:T5SS/PEP-CTERM-associated repeat protein